MALYSIESAKFLAMPHTGEETIDGEVAVELTDYEVDILVKLIKENGSRSVKNLYLRPRYPYLYEKLDKACFRKAYNSKVVHKFLKKFRNNYLEYVSYGLMYYCKDNLGFTYKFKPEYYFDEIEIINYKDDPESYEDEIEEVTFDYFSRWFKKYLANLSDNEARDFFYDITHEDIVEDFVDYTVKIPSAIVNKARK